MKKILAIAVLLIPLIIYLASFKIAAFDERFYKGEFSRYGVYENFPEADSINSGLLHYLQYEKERTLVDIDVFNAKEKQHLLDVKIAVQMLLRLLSVSVFIFIILIFAAYFSDKKSFLDLLSRIFILGGTVTLIYAFLFYLLAVLNFGFLFDGMHRLFFKEGTWLFDASNAVVRIYQEQIFYDIVVRIAALASIISLTLILAGIVYKRHYRHLLR